MSMVVVWLVILSSLGAEILSGGGRLCHEGRFYARSGLAYRPVVLHRTKAEGFVQALSGCVAIRHDQRQQIVAEIEESGHAPL